MPKLILSAAAAAALIVGIAFAGPSGPDTTAASKPIAPTNGGAIFAHYCTPCHGTDGKGHGPVVDEQKAVPVDLTALSRKNHGKFPETHVVNVLQFGVQIPPHTSVEMPVWGPIFGKINRSDPRDRITRVKSLTRYLESIQAN